jgi:hypothetical protein
VTSGAMRRARVRMTIRLMVLRHMVVSSRRSYADLLSTEAERWR